MSRKLKVAAFQKVKNSELVAVMRRTGELAKDYAERHRVPKWYDDADALINDPEVDAIYIATPPGSHKEYTIKVAKAGKPVYVEKPMARNLENARIWLLLVRRRVPLYVAYYRRALPRFVKLKELLDDERLEMFVLCLRHSIKSSRRCKGLRKSSWGCSPN